MGTATCGLWSGMHGSPGKAPAPVIQVKQFFTPGRGWGLCLGRASLERKDLVRPMQEADPRLSFARVQRESDKGEKKW